MLYELYFNNICKFISTFAKKGLGLHNLFYHLSSIHRYLPCLCSLTYPLFKIPILQRLFYISAITIKTIQRTRTNYTNYKELRREELYFKKPSFKLF